MSVIINAGQESYIYPIDPTPAQRWKNALTSTPIIQVERSYTQSTYLLDYKTDLFSQWLAEKWMDWTIEDYVIPHDPYQGEIAGKDFAFIMGAWEWIKDNIDYDPGVKDIDWEKRQASDVLERGGGICSDINILFVAILRSAGIQTRYVEGVKHTLYGYHAWTQVKLDRWYNVDPLLPSNPDFVLHSYGEVFSSIYIPAILGSDTNTDDPFYGEDVVEFFEPYT